VMVGVCMCNIESPASDPSSQSSVVFIGAADLHFGLLVTCRDVITGPSNCLLLAALGKATRSYDLQVGLVRGLRKPLSVPWHTRPINYSCPHL
jgi:hypothetical protein